MLVLNLETGKETIFPDKTLPRYALAYTAAYNEGYLAEFFETWDKYRDTMFVDLPFIYSKRLGRQIAYLGDYGTVI